MTWVSPPGDTGSLSPQGPKGESVGSITQPLPSSYLIFRAASESDGESPPALRVSLVTPHDMGALADLQTGAHDHYQSLPLPPKKGDGQMPRDKPGLGPGRPDPC